MNKINILAALLFLMMNGMLVAQPVASFNSIGNELQDTICNCKCIGFLNTSTSTDTFTSFWTFKSLSGINDSSHQTNPTYCFSTPGNYVIKLIVTSPSGVDSFWISIDVTLCTKPAANISTMPVTDTICAGNCVQFQDASCNDPTSWSWQFPGGSPGTSALQHPPLICYNNAGTYLAKMIATNTFGTDSGYYFIHVITCTGIKNIESENNFSIFPNPASSAVTVHYSQIINQPYHLIITDVLGSIIDKKIITDRDTKIDISNWNKGVYFYEIIGNDLSNTNQHGRFIKN